MSYLFVSFTNLLSIFLSFPLYLGVLVRIRPFLRCLKPVAISCSMARNSGFIWLTS